METVALGPEYRERALQRLRNEHFDVVIVGGGVTGCGAALDAATRGLSVALIEQRDWSAGTSSRSSKLIHGGLRYLEQFDFGLVREALAEQTRMLERLCPHLVRPVPFLFPLKHRFWERLYIGAGTLLYDTLAGKRALPRHRHLSRTAAHSRRFPSSANATTIVGAIEYYDAQVRRRAPHTRRSRARRRSPRCRGDRRAFGPSRVSTEDRAVYVSGAIRARCLETGREDSRSGRSERIINATGVWTERVHAHGGWRPHPACALRRASTSSCRVDRIHGDDRVSSCGPRRACCS